MSTAAFQYLRLSVTSRCSLSCVYCRPPGHGRGRRRPELTVAQLRLLVECAAAEGARKVRITGGEPLEREDLEEITAAVSSVGGIAETVMTTNGVALAGRARALKRAGLDRVNISLDTLRPHRFASIAGREVHDQVLAAVRDAARTFATTKINTVVLRGRNDDEIADFVQFAARTGVRVRFVEYYPTQCSPAGRQGVPAAEVRRRIEQTFGPLVPLPADPLSVEAAYRVPSAGNATIGLIASATDPPCARCTRLRVTSAGVLLPCLFARAGVPLRQLLGRDDGEGVRAAMRQVAGMKDGRRRGARVAVGSWEVGG